MVLIYLIELCLLQVSFFRHHWISNKLNLLKSAIFKTFKCAPATAADVGCGVLAVFGDFGYLKGSENFDEGIQIQEALSISMVNTARTVKVTQSMIVSGRSELIKMQHIVRHQNQTPCMQEVKSP